MTRTHDAMGRPVAARGSPERAVQRSVIAWLRLVLPLGSIAAAIPGEQRGEGATERARGRYGMARKRSGIVTGLPDAVVALPRGGCLWIEFKAPGSGVLQVAQDAVHTRLRSLGHTVLVVTSIEDARHGLQQACVPLRETAGQATALPKVRVARAKVRLPSPGLRL